MAHQCCSVMFDLLKRGNLWPSRHRTHACRTPRETSSKQGNELFSTAEIAARKTEAGHHQVTPPNSGKSKALKQIAKGVWGVPATGDFKEQVRQMAGGLAELFLPSLGLNSSPVIPANANGTKLCIRNHYQHLCSLPRAHCWGSAPRGVQPFIFRQALWKLGRVVYGNVAP